MLEGLPLAFRQWRFCALLYTFEHGKRNAFVYSYSHVASREDVSTEGAETQDRIRYIQCRRNVSALLFLRLTLP